VDHVVRRPDRFPGLQPVEVLLGEGRQVPRAEPGRGGPALQRGQLADDMPAPVPGRLVPGIGPGQGQRGHEVPGAVAADLRPGRFPAAARLGRRFQPVVDPEGPEQPVRVEELQIVGVPALVLLEGTGQELHPADREGPGQARGAVRRVSGYGGDFCWWRHLECVPVRGRPHRRGAQPGRRRSQERPPARVSGHDRIVPLVQGVRRRRGGSEGEREVDGGWREGVADGCASAGE
jgi:hypothetical protein